MRCLVLCRESFLQRCHGTMEPLSFKLTKASVANSMQRRRVTQQLAPCLIRPAAGSPAARVHTIHSVRKVCVCVSFSQTGRASERRPQCCSMWCLWHWTFRQSAFRAELPASLQDASRQQAGTELAGKRPPLPRQAPKLASGLRE